MDRRGVALVTGGARGIGAAIARTLAEDGWRVAVNYLSSQTRAQTLARELGGVAVQADVADFSQVEAMFERVERELGSVELLVNNAGLSIYGLLTDVTPESWRRLFAVNVDGAFYCCRRALPHMIREHRGGIINISSMWGVCGASCEAAYSASKAALIGLTKALAKEVGPSGVRVNCIAPGCVETDMLAGFSGEELAALREETPLGVIGKPEDVAGTARFLASDAGRFITGQVIGVNGGFVI